MSSLPRDCGLSLKAEHFSTILRDRPPVGWFEIHPENYMGDGGPMHRYLSAIRQCYPLSMHGVGMSLGSADGISEEHLAKLKDVVSRYQPEQVSEHLAWSHWNGIFLNDLLPLPYTGESLAVICENIDRVQSFLNRRILVENPSTYIDFSRSDYSEPEFISLICQKTGCGALLDINNVYVCAQNNGFDPRDYLDQFPLSEVGEIHLAGHSVVNLTVNKKICIDDHGSPVIDAVWNLFDQAIARMQTPPPVLIEWDTDIPEFSTLLAEAEKARARIRAVSQHGESQCR